MNESNETIPVQESNASRILNKTPKRITLEITQTDRVKFEERKQQKELSPPRIQNSSSNQTCRPKCEIKMDDAEKLALRVSNV